MAHKDGVFCDEGFKCKKCKEAWGKPTQIEQLTARVRELEEENARLNGVIESNIDDGIDKIMAMSDEQVSALAGFEGSNPEDKATIARQCMDIAMLRVDLAASQLHAEQLREALETLNKVSNIGCGRVEKALALPRDTSALDSYVANQREAAYQEARRAAAQFEAELTRQRDLAVEALHHISLCSQNSMSSQRQCGELARAAIKESEAMAQGEK